MNLVTDPWIPVLTADGKSELANLMQVMTEGERYRDFAVRPHERIALMRLLICIAQAALDGPQDAYSREEELAGLPTAAATYLTSQRGNFDLFDKLHPFLQAPDITALKSKKTAQGEREGEIEATTRTSKLDIALSTGAASSLFDHESLNPGRSMSDAHLALALLTFQCFSPGGLYGQVRWGKSESKKSGNTHAPCLPKSMLHSFVRRSNLIRTVASNTLTKEAIGRHYNKPPSDCWGRPVWEDVPTAFEGLPVENARATYLGRLVPMSRLVLLRQGTDTMLMGSGPAFPAFADGTKTTKNGGTATPFPAEPSATVVVASDNERKLLGASSVAPWRELNALTTSRRQGTAGGALTLDAVPEGEAFDLWVGAFIADKANPIDTVESVLHVPAAARTDNGRRAYEEEMKWADGIGGNPNSRNEYGRLGHAVVAYRRAVDRGWDARMDAQKEWSKKEALKRALQGRATQHFWTAAENLRWMLMDQIEAFGTPGFVVRQKAWRAAVRQAARAAYDLACGKETPRQMRAYAIGYAVLFPSSSASKQTARARRPAPAGEEV